jgi:hypothetical protein
VQVFFLCKISFDNWSLRKINTDSIESNPGLWCQRMTENIFLRPNVRKYKEKA